MTLEHRYVLVNHINIHYVVSAPTSPNNSEYSTLIFLHGFPEYWQTWQAQLDYFSKNYRVIAPDLPGYNLSDKPQETSFYEMGNLIKFITAFINAVSPNEKVTLVAHDWGGAIAWPLAAFYPHCLDKLIILNAAHPSTFTREMINNPEQRNKSAYIHDLISPQAETLLSANHYQYLTDKMMDSAMAGTFTDNQMSLYRKVWQQPGAVKGMLQYYRAMPQLAAANKIKNNAQNLLINNNSASISPVKNTTEMKIPNIHINLPTLVLWGEQDQAFVNNNLTGIEEYVPNCKIKRFPNASHWLTHEKSPEVNDAIADFIKCKCKNNLD